MCGIVGVASKKTVNKQLLQSQLQIINHRGPNDDGIWINESNTVGLGSKRLAIQDLTQNGHMPMSSVDKRYIIIFNGEIYNFKEIRKTLVDRGYTFQSNSDTECVLNAYIAWGTNCLQRFEGMFAIAIFDNNTEELFLARDISGEKPLYYWINENGISFSSELKQLLLEPSLSRKLNRQTLYEYLKNGFVNSESSFIEGVKRVSPAHFLIFNTQTLQVKVGKYWQIPSPKKTNFTTDDLLEQYDKILSEAVKKQLISDVPLGVLLSGGVDSSLITAYASEHSLENIKTFHISFDGFGKYNEKEYAQKVSNYFGCEHHELSGNDISYGMIDDILDYYDEPLADSSMLPTFLVSKLTKQYVTVALGGDGGDELFGGYTSYRQLLNHDNIIGKVPDCLRNTISNTSKHLPVGLKGRNFALSLKGSAMYRFSRNRLFDDYSIEKLISKDFMAEIDTKAIEAESLSDLVYNATKNDFGNYLPNDILVKVDRASMAHSLEMRAPFLDKALIEFAFRDVPSTLKTTKTELKVLSKLLLEKKMPINLDQSRKQGFSIPLADWIANKWYLNIVDDINQFPDFLNKKFALKMCESIKKGYSNSSNLYALIILSKWFNKYNIQF